MSIGHFAEHGHASAAGGASELTDGLERQPAKAGHSIYLAKIGACRCIMCELTGKECVMTIQDAKQARPHCELIVELLDSRQPKTEREHAAAREIEQLRQDARDFAEQLTERPEIIDFACADCLPDYTGVLPGFRCARHRAQSWLSTHPAESKE